MAVTDWVSAPVLNDVPEGYDALHRMWVLGDSTAAPITPYNVPAVQNLTTTPFMPGSTREVFAQGAGPNESFEKRSNFQHDLTVQVLSGRVPEIIARIKGITLGTDYALPMLASTDPVIHYEIVVRDPDGTHIMSKVWRNLILKEWKFDSPMENEVVDLQFYSKLSPFMLYTGAELIVDKFAGDGSTTGFTLSSTPINLSDVSAHDELIDWYYDEIVMINKKLSTQTFGTIQKTGWSNSGTTLTAVTAPAASSVITVTYAKMS